MMRVIAGSAKGARLVAPRGRDIRPTLDRVRETLFNILAPQVADARFLDLFAGTGANGIEALSRGARGCDFLDRDTRSISTIERNLDATRLGVRAKVWRLALPAGLGKLVAPAEGYGIIFADPPYRFAEYDRLFSQMGRLNLLESEGTLVVEHDTRTNLDEVVRDFECTRTTAFGDTTLSFFRPLAEA